MAKFDPSKTVNQFDITVTNRTLVANERGTLLQNDPSRVFAHIWIVASGGIDIGFQPLENLNNIYKRVNNAGFWEFDFTYAEHGPLVQAQLYFFYYGAGSQCVITTARYFPKR